MHIHKTTQKPKYWTQKQRIAHFLFLHMEVHHTTLSAQTANSMLRVVDRVRTQITDPNRLAASSYATPQAEF